jgi:hypothetical protein
MTLPESVRRRCLQDGHACDEGWVCERHPDQPFPHDDCAGPGMPCSELSIRQQVEAALAEARFNVVDVVRAERDGERVPAEVRGLRLDGAERR